MDKFTKFRKMLSFIGGIGLFIALLFIEPVLTGTVLQTLMGYVGILLVGVAMAGRAYSSVYISGYKTQKLITQGPYSITRNPLYFFSLLGYIGIMLAFGSLTILIVVTGAFLAYYIPLMKEEERRLTGAFGDEFTQYKNRVPLLFPRSTKIDSPEDYSVKTPSLLPNIFDTVWFLVVYVLLAGAAELHNLGVLHSVIRVL